MLLFCILKMKETHSSETLVTTYETTQCRNPEDHKLRFDSHKTSTSQSNEVFLCFINGNISHKRLYVQILHFICLLLMFPLWGLSNNQASPFVSVFPKLLLLSFIPCSHFSVHILIYSTTAVGCLKLNHRSIVQYSFHNCNTRQQKSVMSRYTLSVHSHFFCNIHKMFWRNLY